jgi:hypothetical protein
MVAQRQAATFELSHQSVPMAMVDEVGERTAGEIERLRAQARRLGVSIRTKRATRAAPTRAYNLIEQESGRVLGADLQSVDEVRERLWWVVRERREGLIDPAVDPDAHGPPCPSCGTPRLAFFRWCRHCGLDLETTHENGYRTPATVGLAPRQVVVAMTPPIAPWAAKAANPPASEPTSGDAASTASSAATGTGAARVPRPDLTSARVRLAKARPYLTQARRDVADRARPGLGRAHARLGQTRQDLGTRPSRASVHIPAEVGWVALIGLAVGVIVTIVVNAIHF